MLAAHRLWMMFSLHDSWASERAGVCVDEKAMENMEAIFIFHLNQSKKICGTNRRCSTQRDCWGGSNGVGRRFSMCWVYDMSDFRGMRSCQI